MQQTTNIRSEIDIIMVFKIIWKRKATILLFTILSALIFGGYSKFIATAKYECTTQIYVTSQPKDGNVTITTQDIQAENYLVKDYKEAILSQEVLRKTVDRLKFDMTPNELASKIKITIPPDTRIISITASASSSRKAICIANFFRQEATKKITEVGKSSHVTTIDEGVVATKPVSLGFKRSMLLGLVLGFFLIAIIVVVLEIIDDRVRYPEDIENNMGSRLLGVIPDINILK